MANILIGGIKKGHRAIATNAFIYLLSEIKDSVLCMVHNTKRETRPDRSSSAFCRICLFIRALFVYRHLDIKVTWACATSISRKILGSRRSALDIVDFWVMTNLFLRLFQYYLRENQLTSKNAKHTYNLIKDWILPLICNDRIPQDLLEVRKIYETSLKKYDWSKFISSSGGLFNNDASQLIATLLCFNKNDFQAISVIVADVNVAMAKRCPVSKEKIMAGLQRFSKAIRNVLDGYCEKMCQLDGKAGDQSSVEKWCLAKQAVCQIRSLVACEENEAKIREAVRIFCCRANEAGASSCARRLVSLGKLSEMSRNSLEECRLRVAYFKECVEKHDGYKLFGPDLDELSVQRLFWFVWYGTPFDINRECANGLGECDYTVSYGTDDKSIIEIKLGSNSELKANLKNQLAVYKDVNNTEKGLYIIVCRRLQEIEKCRKLAKELELKENSDIYIIDATSKVTASKVR